MPSVVPAQESNHRWWSANPMAYDRHDGIAHAAGTAEWFVEIDRRFLQSAYYARGGDGSPFGRFLRSPEVAGRDVLEIGCGMGTHAAMLARAGARLTAIDLTSRAVAMTRQRFALAHLTARIEEADAERLPFAAGSFDTIWSWGVIHHSRSTERCLAEIARVLRPGGRLIAMVYYRRSLVYYVHAAFIKGVLFGRLRRESLQDIYVSGSDGAYARVFTKHELRSCLANDFADVRLTVVGLKPELWPIPRSRFKVFLERMTPERVARAVLGRWGSMIVIEAVKS